MPETKRIILELRSLRRAARLSGHDLAKVAGVASKNVYDLERGLGNPRFSTVHRICLALSIEIGQHPSTTYSEMFSEETFTAVREIYQKSSRHQSDPDRTVRFKSPRSLENVRASTEVETTGQRVIEAGVGLAGVKSLFVESGYTLVDVAALTGVTYRRLNDVLGPNSLSQQDLLYWTVLRLAAVFAPFRDGNIKETLLYLLMDDLRELDRHYAEREKELSNPD